MLLLRASFGLTTSHWRSFDIYISTLHQRGLATTIRSPRHANYLQVSKFNIG
jgi:hypothetical protein